MSIQHLISTSVSDCRISLANHLESDPVDAAHIAIELLDALRGMEGQASRRKVAAGVLRKAAKVLEVPR